MIESRGPIDASIMIIVDYPSKIDMTIGQLMSGSEGRLLEEMLARNGIDMHMCRIASILRDLPLKSQIIYKTGHLIPIDSVTREKERLRKEIALVNPNIILGLGDNVLHALDAPKCSVDKWRGSILKVAHYIPTVTKIGSKYVPIGPKDAAFNKKLVCTYHPRTILKMYKYRTIAEIDIQRVKKESLTPELNLPIYDICIQPTIDDVLSFLSSLKKGDKVAFDIETVRKRVRCLGLSVRSGHAICIPFMTLSHHTIHPDPSGRQLLRVEHMGGTNGNYWSLEDEWIILEKLFEFFKDETILKIAQNYPFDSSLLSEEFGFLIRGLYMDTLIAQHTLYPELPKSLDFLTTIYTRTPLYSDHNPADDISEWTYNCMDALITREVADRLTDDLEESKLFEFFERKQSNMIAYTRAQNRGIPTDDEIRKVLLKSEQDKLDRSIKDIERTVGRKLNPNSPKQMCEWLYTDNKLPVKRSKGKNGKSGNPTAGEKVLRAFAVQYDHLAEAIYAILDYRKAVKMIGTFLDKELVNGKTLTTYNVAGTVTGRLSASSTLWEEGVNITQTPKTEMRRMFIAPPGYKWIHSDLSQAEARFVFWDANATAVIERYMDDPLFDVHTWNAAMNIFHIDESMVTPEQRQLSKAGVHGGNYALGYKTAAMMYQITVAEARKCIDGYRNGIPEIEEWWTRIEDEVTRTRTLYTPLGRRRQFLGRLDNMLFRSAYAHRPQSTIGDIVHRAFTYCDIHLPAGSYPIIQMHDEINVLALEKDVEQCLDVLRESFNCPISFEHTRHALNIPLEVSIGPNWWDQEEIK